LDTRPTPSWWLDAKFGIFIHWGVYAVPGFTAKGNYSEWYQYALETNAHKGKVREYHKTNYGERSYYDLADDFHAELFDANEWAKLFEDAGAKYAVLTSKHHDGYCLWPNEDANRNWGFPWNSDARGPKRDLVGEFMAALNKTSVKPGLYFSLYEWFNPIWKFDQEKYAAEHAMPQLYELVQDYKPWVVWSDGDWDATPELWQSQSFLAWLYNDSPVRDRVVANDRWGNGVRFRHGGFYTPEYQPDLDFEDHPWEESRGMGASYGYNRAEDAWDYQSGQALVLHLVDKVSRGGNFLLGIGPDAHGKIPPIMQERLLEIGRWLKLNGEAIYGTRRWRTPAQWSEGRRDWSPKEGGQGSTDLLLKQVLDPDPGFAAKEVFFTWKPQGKTLYAIFPKYPKDKKLVLKGLQLPAGIHDVVFLSTKEKCKAENLGGNIVIHLPEYSPQIAQNGQAFCIKISGFGEFAAKPKIELNYHPSTAQPTVKMSVPTPGATIRFTLDGKEPTDASPAYTAPITPTAPCTVRAKAFKMGILASNTDSVSIGAYQIQPALNLLRQPAPGLRAELRTLGENEKYTIEKVPKAFLEKVAIVENIKPDEYCVENKCGMVWKGYIEIPATGGYQFWTESDDGSRLYLDGELVVDNDGDHGMTEKTGIAFLEKGWHAVQIVYFNSGGGCGLKVHYAPLGEMRRELEGELLGH
jgi:alpha-L-fucosidase